MILQCVERCTVCVRLNKNVTICCKGRLNLLCVRRSTLFMDQILIHALQQSLVRLTIFFIINQRSKIYDMNEFFIYANKRMSFMTENLLINLQKSQNKPSIFNGLFINNRSSTVQHPHMLTAILGMHGLIASIDPEFDSIFTS